MELEFLFGLDDFRRGGERLRNRYDEVLAELSKQEDQLAYLDRCRKHEDSALFDTAKALASMEPAAVLEHFQPEVLVWAAANTTFQDEWQRMNEGLELLGIDRDMFEYSRMWEWKVNHNSFGTNVLNQYSVLEALQGPVLEDIDLDAYLAKHAKEGVTISKERAADYGLQPLRLRAGASDIFDIMGYEQNYGHFREDGIYGMYLDTPSGFALMYKGQPQAVIAMAAEGQNAIAIHQLQGFRGYLLNSSRPEGQTEPRQLSSRGLAVLDWRGLMVDLTTNVAEQIGKSKIIIKSGMNNHWTKPRLPSGTPHLTVEQALAAYDEQAARLGFDQRTDGDWQLAVAS